MSCSCQLLITYLVSFVAQQCQLSLVLAFLKRYHLYLVSVMNFEFFHCLFLCTGLVLVYYNNFGVFYSPNQK